MGPGGLDALTLAALALAAVLAAAVAWLATRRRREVAARAHELATTQRRPPARPPPRPGRDGVVLHAPDGTVLLANDAAARAVDMPAADLVGRRVGELPVRWTTEQGQDVAPAAVFSPPPTPGGPPFVVGLAPRTGASVR